MEEKTILPADTYTVINKTVLKEFDRKLITMLYQPIIGYTATSLYFTLIDDLDKREVMSDDLTHHHLMSTMQLKLEKIVIARKKLEAVGLLRTYFKKDQASNNNYVYLLYSPMSASEFLNHPILNIVLYNNLGKKEYDKIVDFFKVPRIHLKDFEDITCRFDQVFSPVSGNVFIENENIMKEVTSKIRIEPKIDFDLLISSIPSNMVSPRCFNDDTKEFSVTRAESSSSFLEIVEDLDKILDQNVELVKPQIDCSWEFYNKGYEHITVYPSPDHDNPVVEKGYKVVFKGVYHWEHEDGKKDPVSISKDSTWKELTESGVNSSRYTSVFLTEDTTIKVQLEAPKTGMMVVRGEDVVFSDGKLDITEDTRTVRFGDRIYYGPCPKGEESEFVEYDIRSLSETRIVLDGELHTFTSGKITTDPDKYYVIGIPESLGELKGIWSDGFPVMGAFHKLNNIIEVINAAGFGINYIVYVSNNPGAFSNVTLEFK